MDSKSLSSLALLTLLAAVPARGGTVLTVDLLTDESDSPCIPGDCSLREALADATEDDEIQFALPGSPPWTIRVASTLSIDVALTITGPGATQLAISGDSDGNGTGNVRVLRVETTGAPVISGLTLRDGLLATSGDRDGGCLRNLGDTALLSVRLESCRGWSGGTSLFSGLRGGDGGAIYSGPGTALLIDGSTLAGNTAGTGDIGPDGTTAGPGGRGGAIVNFGVLTVRRSTFSGNSAGLGGSPNGNGGEGGAIAHLGDLLWVEESTFEGNRSGDGRNIAFGVGADGAGGAAYLAADAAFNNVTLSGNAIGSTAVGANATGGAIQLFAGVTRLRNVTIAGNTANGAGGGVARSGGTLRVRNSIVGGNVSSGTTSEDCTTNAAVSTISEGHNLVTVTTGCAGVFVGAGDQVGPAGVGPLANNGGPTQTRALQSTSLAIDGGDAADCLAWDPILATDVAMPTDQRGFARELDGDGDTVAVCDAGAFEAPVPAPAENDLTVVLAGGGAGSVTSVPAGIDCPGDCTESYPETETVELTATADAGSIFVGWSGACSGTGVCSVDMDVDRTATATFELLRNLTVSRTGSGSGGVTSAPPGIDCGSDCSEDYAHGTDVTLTATPAPGSAFAGWSGACSGTGICAVDMTQDRSASASFVPLRTLSVARVGDGVGTVTSVPGGIGCGSDCTEDYVDGTDVTLTATPSSGSFFAGWSGDCTGGSCVLDMTANRTATATFRSFTIFVDGFETGNTSRWSATQN